MPDSDTSPLEWIARLAMFSWVRPEPKDDGGHCEGDDDIPDLCGLDMKAQQPRQKQQQQEQRSSPPKLCTTEESVPQTAPVSTCDSSAASWSDVVVGSSDSSAGGATHDMVTFHRLGADSGPRRSSPPPALTLTVDPAPAPAPARAASPMEIPWRLVDPESNTTPLQKALSHSLAQMELRMSLSGRHTTKNAPTASSTVTHPNHRRALSALPASRADAASDGRVRAALAEGRSGALAPPTSFWKQTPRTAAAAAAVTAADSFDEDVPSPGEREKAEIDNDAVFSFADDDLADVADDDVTDDGGAEDDMIFDFDDL